MIYLSGVSNDAIRQLAHPRIGLMLTIGNGYARQVAEGVFPCWAADNECFTRAREFKPGNWLAWLNRLPRQTCLFAVAPDVVGDPEATRARSLPVLDQLRRLGYRAAYVAQDGQEPAQVPWDALDCLFAGGTTAWKLSAAMWDLAAEARARGKWTHMGRVNSSRRIRAAASAGYDSVDGTFLSFRARQRGATPLELRGPQEVAAWLERIEQNPYLPMEACM